MANPILITGPKQESVEVLSVSNGTICARRRIVTKMRRKVGKSFHLRNTIAELRNMLGREILTPETD